MYYDTVQFSLNKVHICLNSALYLRIHVACSKYAQCVGKFLINSIFPRCFTVTQFCNRCDIPKQIVFWENQITTAYTICFLEHTSTKGLHSDRISDSSRLFLHPLHPSPPAPVHSVIHPHRFSILVSFHPHQSPSMLSSVPAKYTVSRRRTLLTTVLQLISM